MMPLKISKYTILKKENSKSILKTLMKSKNSSPPEMRLPEKNSSKYLAQSFWVMSKKSVKIRILCSRRIFGTINSKR